MDILESEGFIAFPDDVIAILHRSARFDILAM
jgi:hypothetical protein